VLARIAADGADGGLILVTADGAIETAFNSPGMKRALASSSQPALVGAIGGAVRPVRRSTSKGETT
jgi:isoaspartyl peptidase/L-asparaginase-like protein (Ntn-hydrolase superfamily)